MLEIFAGAFLLMLLLFVLITQLNTLMEESRQQETVEPGEYRISWENNAEGFIVIAMPDKIRIAETQEAIPISKVCQPNGPFLKYAYEKYSQQKKQLIFAILEGGVRSMYLSRNCLKDTFGNYPITIGWIAANQDILKAVNLNELPTYIKKGGGDE